MPTNANFYLSLQQGIQASHSKPCISGPDFPELTYLKLEKLTAQVANLLKGLNINAGARVLAQTPKTPLAVALYLACLRSGAIYVPLNNGYTTDELDYFIEDTEPDLFVCSSSQRRKLEELFAKHNIPSVLELDENGHGSLFDSLIGLSDEHEVEPVDADDHAS